MKLSELATEKYDIVYGKNGIGDGATVGVGNGATVGVGDGATVGVGDGVQIDDRWLQVNDISQLVSV